MAPQPRYGESMTGAGGVGREFRPEIQALRALAVALVLVFHLAPDRLSGGYVGVDVFFVISGFLITGHLAREGTATGRISLVRFWGGRIRRLLPAATVVLLASLAGTVAFVPRSLWQDAAIQIGASALYVQNWVLGVNAVDYLAGTNDPTAVQHYWSLSVEEQFYVVVPLMLIVTLALARTRRREAIVGALLITATGSLAYSAIETASNPSFAYFNTGTRAWEFALGGLLALGPTTWLASRTERTRRMVGAGFGWVGLGLIVAAAVSFDRSTPFPGVSALIPVAGAALVILAGGAGGSVWAPAFLASFGPLQLVGRLSYSIYLWHWPLIVITPYAVGHGLGLSSKLAIVVATLGLAWLTTRFVEDPIRFGSWWRIRDRRSIALGVASIVAIVTVASTTWVVVERGIDDARQRSEARLQSDVCYGAPALLEPGRCDDPFAVQADLDTAFAAQDGWRLSGECSFPDPTVGLQWCQYGQTVDPTTTVLFVGNSHATHLVPAAVRYGDDLGWDVELMTRRNCLGLTTDPVGAAPDPGCLDWSRAVLDHILSRDDLDLVVFPAYRSVLHYIAPDNPSEAELAALRLQIADVFEQILAHGVRVAVIDDSPAAPANIPECVDVHRAEYDPCTFEDDTDAGNVVTEAADLVPAVTRIDPRPWTCDERECHAVVGGVVVYFDDNHLTGTYSRTLAPYVGAELERALEAPTD